MPLRVADRFASLVLVLVLSLGSPTESRADEPSPAPVWYGYELLAADVASDAIILLPPQSQRTDSGLPGGVGYLGLAGVTLGAPVIHALHGRVDRALGSLGLRTLALGAGGLLHAIAGSECWKEFGTACDRSERLAYLVPLAVVELVDAAALGWQPAGRDRAAAAPKVALVATPRGAAVLLAGAF